MRLKSMQHGLLNYVEFLIKNLHMNRARCRDLSRQIHCRALPVEQRPSSLRLGEGKESVSAAALAMAQSLAERLAQDSKEDFGSAEGLENRHKLMDGSQKHIRLVHSGAALVKSWAFWTVLLAVTMLALDPLQVRKMLALARSYQYFYCQNTNSQCSCFPAPDVDGWPSDKENRLLASEFFFDTGIPGPETLAWDLQGDGPYTGLADGRVLRWNKISRSFESFAHASPHWVEELCAYSNRGTHSTKLNLEHRCGRPLGLKFHPVTGELFFVDAYFGLAKVSHMGGQATLLANQSLGVAHAFSNDLDIHEDGVVYFTVSSTRRPRRECNLVIMERESTGRVLAYDPKTEMTSVIIEDLHYPNGIAISKDGTFLVVAVTSANTLLRYWLQGPLTGIVESFAELPGFPDNIQSTENGDFWVALHGRRSKFQTWLCNNGWSKRIMFSLYNTYDGVAKFFANQVTPIAIKYDAEGRILDVLEDRTKTSPTQFVSNAVERDGKLWLSSVYSPIISFYNLEGDQCSVPPENVRKAETL